MDYSGLPELLRDGMQRYIESQIRTGSFLECVLKNDLFGALGKADDLNRYRLFEICAWIYNNAPGECYGSAEKVERWIAGRG